MLKNTIKLLFFTIKIFIPSNKNLLIFGDRAGRRFCDNSRYLFFYISSLKIKKRCVWLSKEKKIVNQLREAGFESYLSNSFMGIYLSIISGWHIYNFGELDTSPFFAQFSNNVNLWHGILFKKLRKNNNDNFFFRLSSFFYKKYLVYPNKNYSKHLLNHYPRSKYKILISNQPRNVLLINNNKYNLDIFTTNNEKKIYQQIKLLNKKIIGYFPTWRENGLELFPSINNFNDLIKLNNILKNTNSILLVKKHPNSFKEDNHSLYNKKIEIFYKEIKKLNNFYLLDYNTDLNSIINLCDTLISDYSGAIFDYLLLNRPIIFYTPDLAIYNKKVGMNFSLDKINIGPIILSFKDLLNILSYHHKYPHALNKKYEKNRENFRKKIFKNEECFDQIMQVLN